MNQKSADADDSVGDVKNQKTQMQSNFNQKKIKSKYLSIQQNYRH